MCVPVPTRACTAPCNKNYPCDAVIDCIGPRMRHVKPGTRTCKHKLASACAANHMPCPCYQASQCDANHCRDATAAIILSGGDSYKWILSPPSGTLHNSVQEGRNNCPRATTRSIQLPQKHCVGKAGTHRTGTEHLQPKEPPLLQVQGNSKPMSRDPASYYCLH